MSMAIVALTELERYAHEVSGKDPIRWRVYAQDASRVEERWTKPYFGQRLRITQRVTDGWYEEGWSAKSVIALAEAHGPGRYLIAMFTRKPFGNWRGQVAAVIVVAEKDGHLITRDARPALAYDPARAGGVGDS